MSPAGLVWILPASLVIGFAAADFVGGAVHWFADTYFDPESPIVRNRIIIILLGIGIGLALKYTIGEHSVFREPNEASESIRESKSEPTDDVRIEPDSDLSE